jgi:hypothetical protein
LLRYEGGLPRKEDQEMAEAYKRFIKNCISRWNYLSLLQKFAEIDNPVKRNHTGSLVTMRRRSFVLEEGWIACLDKFRRFGLTIPNGS